MIWSLKEGPTFKLESQIEPGKNLVDLEWLDDNSEHL